MGKKGKARDDCRTSREFYECALRNGGKRKNGARHPGVVNPKTGRFIPIPEHGRKSEPLPPDTASAIRRSFKLEGWVVILLIVGPVLGALMFVLGG